MPTCVGLLLLAACSSTAGDGGSVSPGGREFHVDRCMRGVALSSPGDKQIMKATTGVAPEQQPTVFCNRMAKAVRSGRVTMGDFNKLSRTGQKTEIWRVLKGQ